FWLQKWNERLQCLPAVANQTDFHRETQTNLLGIEIDLNSFCLIRLGQEFDIRERTANDEKRVAVFHCFLRRLRAQQSDGAGCVRAVVRYGTSPEKSFNNRGSQHFGDLFKFLACTNCSPASQDRYFLSSIQEVSSSLQIGAWWKLRHARVGVRGVMRNVALGAPQALDLLLLEVDRNRDMRYAFVRKSRTTSQVSHVFHVIWSHDSLVVNADIHEQLV